MPIKKLTRYLIAGLLLLSAQPLWSADEEEPPKVISYYQIKPSLVANLASGGKYIRCDIQLMTKDEAFLEILNQHGPAIRHSLLLLLSEQNGAELKTTEGKEALRKQALSEIDKLMQTLEHKNAVEGLFFTTFFVQ
ncbi:MAG: flagellar basal body-associated FliL family protein [Candidatus Thiodiazotropha sp.]